MRPYRVLHSSRIIAWQLQPLLGVHQDPRAMLLLLLWMLRHVLQDYNHTQTHYILSVVHHALRWQIMLPIKCCLLRFLRIFGYSFWVFRSPIGSCDDSTHLELWSLAHSILIISASQIIMRMIPDPSHHLEMWIGNVTVVLGLACLLVMSEWECAMKLSHTIVLLIEIQFHVQLLFISHFSFSLSVQHILLHINLFLSVHASTLYLRDERHLPLWCSCKNYLYPLNSLSVR